MTSDHIQSRLWLGPHAPASSAATAVPELVDRVPHLGDARCPSSAEHVSTRGVHAGDARAHEVERAGVVGGGVRGGRGEVAVGLVDHHEVGELHDPALEALQLVAAARRDEHEEEVDHRRDLHLRLADADRLDQHDVEAGGLAQQQRLARAARDAAERAAGRRRAHERVRRARQLLHAGLVAEDRAAAARARRVDREHRDAVVVLDEVSRRAPR